MIQTRELVDCYRFQILTLISLVEWQRNSFSMRRNPHMARKIERVLLVDDEDDHHFLTRMALKRSGYTGILTSCYTAEDAIEHLRNPKLLPDLFLVDINMPFTSGFELLVRCEREGLLPNGHTLVVMCSSSNRPMDIDAARRFTCVDDYVEKSFSAEQFERLQGTFARKAA